MNHRNRQIAPQQGKFALHISLGIDWMNHKGKGVREMSPSIWLCLSLVDCAILSCPLAYTKPCAASDP